MVVALPKEPGQVKALPIVTGIVAGDILPV